VKRTDRILLGLMVVMAVTLIWVVAGTLEPPVINSGGKAPSFNVVTDRGNTISPTQFGGKLLVLNFWATWCAGCVQEITSLDAFQRTFASQGVVVLGVNMDANEMRYQRFLQRFPVSFVTMRDPAWNISASYGTFQLPETYIIDRSGKVVEKIIAAHNFMDPDFLARIHKMLSSYSPPS
jgi:cytochrome c biogenesis protein CcmG, thiol:disulfide interchange protein DsbE